MQTCESVAFDLNTYTYDDWENRYVTDTFRYTDCGLLSSDFSNLRASVFPRENVASVDHESFVPRCIATGLCHDESFIVRLYVEERLYLRNMWAHSKPISI